MVDALDECSDPDVLCTWIRDTQRWRFETVHLLFTSRTFPKIEAVLSNVKFVDIPFQNEQVDEDIARHVDTVLQCDRKLSTLPRHLQLKIKDSLVEGAKGMFRWAECMLKVLKKCPSPSTVKKVLGRLPPDLDAVYERILSAVDPMNQDAAERILTWLVFCKRPLRAEELLEAAAIDFEELRDALAEDPSSNKSWVFEDPPQVKEPCFSPSNRFFEVDRNIEALCPGILVCVRGTYPDPADRSRRKEATFVKLAHYSIMEYLVSDRILLGSAERFKISVSSANLLIGAGCLAYLADVGSLESENLPLGPRQLTTYPLIEYAARNWLVHVSSGYQQMRRDDDQIYADILYTIMTYLFDKTGIKNAMVLGLFETHMSSCSESSTNAIGMPIYYASQFGLQRVLERLLHHDSDPNVRGGWKGTPLAAAASVGGLSTVKRLIDHGADVDLEDNFQTPLTAAARRGDEKTLQLLLENKADPNHRCTLVSCSSMYESRTPTGRSNLRNQLIERGMDHSAPATRTVFYHEARMPTALHAAIVGGHRNCVEILIKAGTELNADGLCVYPSNLKIGDMAIPYAAVRRSSCTPLEAACTSFYIGHDSSAGYCAPIYSGDPDIVDLLLRHGAKPTSSTLQLLAWSVMPDKARITRLVISKLSEVPPTDEIFTSILKSPWNGLDVVEAVIEGLGGRIVVTQEVLQIAAQYQSTDVFERLLDMSSLQPNTGMFVAAAKNRKSGLDMTKCLQSRSHQKTYLNNEIVLAILENDCTGGDIYRLFANDQGEFCFDADHLATAVGSNHLGLALHILTTSPGLELTEAVVDVAIRSVFGGSIAPLLFVGALFGRLSQDHEALLEPNLGVSQAELRDRLMKVRRFPYSVSLTEDSLALAIPLIHVPPKSVAFDLAMDIIGSEVQATETSALVALRQSEMRDDALRRLLELPRGILMSHNVHPGQISERFGPEDFVAAMESLKKLQLEREVKGLMTATQDEAGEIETDRDGWGRLFDGIEEISDNELPMLGKDADFRVGIAPN